jgi:hypothetical protein
MARRRNVQNRQGDVLGWDQSQVRTWDGICRHTALAVLAQVRAAAIRDALHGSIQLTAADTSPAAGTAANGSSDDQAGDADLQIPLSDAPVPVRAASRARPASARSGCPSPRPRG